VTNGGLIMEVIALQVCGALVLHPGWELLHLGSLPKFALPTQVLLGVLPTWPCTF